ncbi:Headcase N-terminal domain-containing protein [Caenorhabditis elegans]|uniref:Headcase N-terminal domain-containing protein n=1 Tax=Caenorhabditis elegans TaxID=6239 RepID=O16485_CAEEL|nr:Uncharacterized protein CELE_B0238.9 [Caenorhabditis elegans]CCD61482.1 Uncharacterized protein CELE_B0238.9 [Caenorhabditis elegans]|eukprot:NP_001256059.1 Uncharacterized protein CELE_B0238.9 [Caenorhabditis elegans]
MPRGLRRADLVKRHRHSTTGDKDGGVPEVIGCPVLDPIICQCPKDEIELGEGVKMTCTWESCPYSSRPLHHICYQLLEDNLVKRLASLGSARGWTVPQRRNNLWERKGQSLIGKFCRCRCDRGQMTRDKQALYEKEKAVEKEKKKKAKKAKQLPQLQFNSKPLAAIEEKKRGDADVFHSPSIASSTRHHTFSTTTRSRLHTDRSASSILTHTIGRTWSESSFAGETNGQYDNNQEPHPSNCECVFHHDYDADDQIDTDFECESNHSDVIVPAPLPPLQAKSYAATIMRNGTPKVTNYSPDSGLDQQTPRFSLSSSSGGDVDNQHGDFHVETRISEHLNALGLSIMSPVENANENVNYEESPFYPELTSTPIVSKKQREPLRAKKSTSVSKLPLAPSSQLFNEESRCGFRFNVPVREMMDIWQESGALSPAIRETQAENTEKRAENASGVLQYGWTPFFGNGFNLGERLYYFP